jgi:hypothetical protein
MRDASGLLKQKSLPGGRGCVADLVATRQKRFLHSVCPSLIIQPDRACRMRPAFE